MSADQPESLIISPTQLGQVLRGYRKYHGLTQHGLGIRVGLTQASISLYENDASRLNIENLLRLLSELHLELVLREKPSEDVLDSEW